MMFQKSFCKFKTIMDNFFFKISFFIIKCAPFLLKIEGDFTIDD